MLSPSDSEFLWRQRSPADSVHSRPNRPTSHFISSYMVKVLNWFGGVLLGIASLVNTANSAYLELVNVPENSDVVGASGYYFYHANGKSEGQDAIGDVLWENFTLPPQFPFWLRLSSNPWGKLLKNDARSSDSTTPVDVGSDVMSRDAPSGEVNCDNYLWVREINNKDGAFTGKPITFEQKPLANDPNQTKYPVYDVRRAKNFNSGRIDIYDPNGAPHKLNRVYNDGETDWKGVIRFDRYVSDIDDDGKVDIEDLERLAANWCAEGFALAGDISGPNGVPDGKVDMLDAAVMSEEWGK